MRRHSKFLSSKTTITPIAVKIEIIDIEKLKININHSFDPIQISEILANMCHDLKLQKLTG